MPIKLIPITSTLIGFPVALPHLIVMQKKTAHLTGRQFPERRPPRNLKSLTTNLISPDHQIKAKHDSANQFNQ